jgi:hypothetical protein
MTTIKQRRAIPLLCVLLAFSGCAGDNVTGRALATGETFTGSSSAGLIGGDSLSLQSSKGTKCEGRTMGSETIGSSVAVITCDDGRAGSVVFIDGPDQSVGRGVLGNDQVTLTIAK